MLARSLLVVLACLAAEPAVAANFPLSILPFGIELHCIIKPTSSTTSYLQLTNLTNGLIAAGTRVDIKTDHSAPFTVTLGADLPPGAHWSVNSVPVFAKQCTARTATLRFQLPPQELSQ
jgi:hypothetical protein